eukprot:6707964-Alexandrium_andersonii.AAC.1
MSAVLRAALVGPECLAGTPVMSWPAGSVGNSRAGPCAAPTLLSFADLARLRAASRFRAACV